MSETIYSFFKKKDCIYKLRLLVCRSSRKWLVSFGPVNEEPRKTAKRERIAAGWVGQNREQQWRVHDSAHQMNAPYMETKCSKNNIWKQSFIFLNCTSTIEFPLHAAAAVPHRRHGGARDSRVCRRPPPPPPPTVTVPRSRSHHLSMAPQSAVASGRLVVLYASRTGNAMDVAERVLRKAERGGCLDVDVVSMDIFDPVRSSPKSQPSAAFGPHVKSIRSLCCMLCSCRIAWQMKVCSWCSSCPQWGKVTPRFYEGWDGTLQCHFLFSSF